MKKEAEKSKTLVLFFNDYVKYSILLKKEIVIISN
jgi:hypothetical protein